MQATEEQPMSPPPKAAGAPNGQPRPVGTPGGSSVRLTGMTLLLLFLVLLLVLPLLAERLQFAITRGDQRAKAEVAKTLLKELPDPSRRFPWVAKRIEPSVVGIETVRMVSYRAGSDGWSTRFHQAGEGSGIIVDAEGYVLTNYHVIEGAQVTVRLSDGQTVRNVRIVGADPEADLAVLKIDAGGLVAADWGDSDALEVGDEVLAVGNPFGLARSVTAGIISAKGRPGVVGELWHQEALQTDAAVNPGNSGGPLVNLKGEVVGINTAIVGRLNQGVSFAIPSRIAREVYEELKTTGNVKPRGFLGVRMKEITFRQAAELGLDRPRGVSVVYVEPESPAEVGGITPGDVILEWNGQQIENRPDLSLAVVRTKIGSEATVALIREGRELKVRVTVGMRPVQISQ
ncbi:MAG: S1C family serine protease [Planctomycetota bacterium]|jgi:serine protease Do